MAKTVTLTCAYDGHRWRRPVKRGRKPRYCPKHTPDTTKPEPVPVAPEPEPEPEPKPASRKRSKYVTLWCESGHEWQRECKRGRAPRMCPEHTAIAKSKAREARADKPARKLSPEHKAALHAGRQAKQQADKAIRTAGMAERVAEFREWNRAHARAWAQLHKDDTQENREALAAIMARIPNIRELPSGEENKEFWWSDHV